MRLVRIMLQYENLTLILTIFLSALLFKSPNLTEGGLQTILNAPFLSIITWVTSVLCLIICLVRLLHRVWATQDCHLQLRRIRDLFWLQLQSKEFQILLAMLQSDYLNILAFQWVDRLGETVRIRNCHRVTRNYFTNSLVYVQKMKRKLRKKLLAVAARDFSAFFDKIKEENQKLSVVDRDDWLGFQYALRPGIDNFESSMEESEPESTSESEEDYNETSEDEIQSEHERQGEEIEDESDGEEEDFLLDHIQHADEDVLGEFNEAERDDEAGLNFRANRHAARHRQPINRVPSGNQILQDKNYKWPHVDYTKIDGEIKTRSIILKSKTELRQLSIFAQVKELYLQLNSISLALRAKLEFLQLDQYRKFTRQEFESYELRKRNIEIKSGLTSFEIRETLSKNDTQAKREFESEKEAQRCCQIAPKRRRKKKSREGEILYFGV